MAWIETSSGIALPAPELGSSGVSISTLVDGGRNAQGKFIGSVIGGDKMTIECSFGRLSPEEFQRLLAVFDRSQGGRFVNDFVVYDPRVRDFVTKTMYVGDRSGTPCAVDPGSFTPGYWKNCKCKLIET